MSSFEIACEECGGEYEPAEDGPEHHDPGCPVRAAMIARGRWDDPEGDDGE